MGLRPLTGWITFGNPGSEWVVFGSGALPLLSLSLLDGTVTGGSEGLRKTKIGLRALPIRDVANGLSLGIPTQEGWQGTKDWRGCHKRRCSKKFRRQGRQELHRGGRNLGWRPCIYQGTIRNPCFW